MGLNMENRYQLTRAENVFIARKHWPDSIYSGMRMENRNVTFPQTETILAGINVAGVSLDDIQAILNMRDAWRFLLDNLDQPISVEFLCEIQDRVAFREALAWGTLRDGSVGISGVSYVPPIPNIGAVRAELMVLLEGELAETEKALDLFCWVARSQLFWDGNKRAAMLAANKLLIEAGAGVLLIADSDMLEFSTLLSDFYETGKSEQLKTFLYEKAIYGIEMPAIQVGNRTADWLKTTRRAKGFTQKQLAQVIGVATNTIANIEQGQRKGSDAVWQKIEQLLA